MAETGRHVRVLGAVWLLAIGLCVASQAIAQDPRASLVQEAARAWLADTDRGDAARSWKRAGKRFRDAITVERWAESLRQVRPPLGEVSQRGLLGTQFRRSIPGAADGDYAIIVFRTTFTKKSDARETVTLEREADGVWRVAGYFIH